MSKRRIEQDQEPGTSLEIWLFLEGATKVDPLEGWDKEIEEAFDKMNLETDRELGALEDDFQRELGQILNAGAAEFSAF